MLNKGYLQLTRRPRRTTCADCGSPLQFNRAGPGHPDNGMAMACNAPGFCRDRNYAFRASFAGSFGREPIV